MKPDSSANSSGLTRNICVKFKLLLTGLFFVVFVCFLVLGFLVFFFFCFCFNKLLMSQDIIYWSLILKTKQSENTRDIKGQTGVVAYFSGGDFFDNISFGE